jgi:chemosensory pili system protein ChpC
MNAQAVHDIRGVLITVTGGRLLLPNASVAEVITYSDPEPVEGAPSWLLGRSRWRGWAMPVVSFARLVGWASQEAELGAKVAVLKAIGGNPAMPYFAVLTQGFPRLVTVTTAALQQTSGDRDALPAGIHAQVLFNDDDAVVPDLLAVEAKLVDVLGLSAKA